MTFLNFTGFGWNDPVALICDTVWNPAGGLGEVERKRFLAGAVDDLPDGNDTGFGDRLRALHPLHGLDRVLSLLRDLAPDRARRLAGEQGLSHADFTERQANRLTAARACLKRLHGH